MLINWSYTTNRAVLTGRIEPIISIVQGYAHYVHTHYFPPVWHVLQVGGFLDNLSLCHWLMCSDVLLIQALQGFASASIMERVADMCKSSSLVYWWVIDVLHYGRMCITCGQTVDNHVDSLWITLCITC